MYVIRTVRLIVISEELGDEFHNLLICSFMSDMRKNCINNTFFRNANMLQFGELLNQTKLSKLKKTEYLSDLLTTMRVLLVNFGMNNFTMLYIVYLFLYLSMYLFIYCIVFTPLYLQRFIRNKYI
jgi:hypothetical protein